MESIHDSANGDTPPRDGGLHILGQPAVRQNADSGALLASTFEVVPGEWDAEVENWLRWARTPGFDAYWYYRDAFFDTILPTRRGRTLEIGCGEGRVARDLAERGYQVTALDSASGLVRHAREADTDGLYLVGEGARLPVREGWFDLVFAYNALQVVANMPQTVKESARGLRPGGHLCFCVAHPATDMGRRLDEKEMPTFALRVPYFESTRVEDTVEKDGLRVTFRGWTYTLEDYAVALQEAGFAIETIREPIPATDSRYAQWRQLPLFMNGRGVKR